jgi:TonB family protein
MTPATTTSVVSVVASALAHAALAAAIGGHGRSDNFATASKTEISVDVVAPAAVAPSSEPVTENSPAARSNPGAVRTHTHPYPVSASHDAHPHDPALVHAPLAIAPKLEVAPAAPPVTSNDALPRFTLPASTNSQASRTTSLASNSLQTSGVAKGATGGEHATSTGDVFDSGAVSVPARLVASAAIRYPSPAREAEIEADVPVQIVIDEGGNVIEARPLAHSGFGLDEAAVSSVRQYRFSPASKDGRRVRVRMRWVVQFRLR